MTPPPLHQQQAKKSGCLKWFLILFALGLAGFLVLFVAAAFFAKPVGPAPPAPALGRNPGATGTVEAPAREISPVTWAEIHEVYGIGTQSTDIVKDERWKAYKGQTIQWKGEVAEVSKDFMGNYTLAVKMAPDTFTFDVLVKLREDQMDAAFKLKKGDPVVYQAQLLEWGSLLPITADEGMIVQ